jgi:hypothetical protein
MAAPSESVCLEIAVASLLEFMLDKLRGGTLTGEL